MLEAGLRLENREQGECHKQRLVDQIKEDFLFQEQLNVLKLVCGWRCRRAGERGNQELRRGFEARDGWVRGGWAND